MVEGRRYAALIRSLPDVRTTIMTVGADDQRTQNVAAIYVGLTPPGASRGWRRSSRPTATA